MLAHPVMYEYLARQRTTDLIREAEQSRLVRLATAARESADVKTTGILVRVSQSLGAAYRTYIRPSVIRPSVSPAG